MEAVVRKPFQGVINIVRFNWHFYVIASIIIVLLALLTNSIPQGFRWAISATIIIICSTTLVTLLVSYFVYDRSGLYNFTWLKDLKAASNATIVNINAGFDETSAGLKLRYPHAHLRVFDFYDPAKHTEVSIERARKAYAPYPNTKAITTSQIPITAGSVDLIFNIFAIHEIRNRGERIGFLKQQYEILSDNGRCVVVEHQRDIANFMAYNIGFFHFYSRAEWMANFSNAGFTISTVKKITPFVTVYILKK
jgi:hypothetical protein